MHTITTTNFFVQAPYLKYKTFAPTSSIKGLHMAASIGDLAKVKSVIESYDIVYLCIYRDDDGNAALHHAAMTGHLDVVKYLSAIEEVNPASPGKDSMTPLHFASMYGYLDIVAFLIDEQLVDPMCYNNKGQTPFFLACKYGHLEVAKTVLEALLIYRKLEDIIHETDASNITVIYDAYLHHRLNILKWLLSTLKCNLCGMGITLSDYHVHLCSLCFVNSQLL